MKTSKSPFIATWLLDRFGNDPQLDAVAGDLLEQYRLGRSRFWYWREVITAITVGTWAAFRDHTLLMLRALVIGWVLTVMFGWIVEHSLFPPLLENRYAFVLIPVVALLTGGPWCASIGWIVAQCARQCCIPAMLGFAMSWLLSGLASHIHLIIREGINLELSLSLLVLAGVTVSILFGGGLLTGSPKRLTQMRQ